MSKSSQLAREVLAEYGGLAHGALTECLRRESRREQVYRLASDYPLRRGRSLRGSLCIAAAKAFGASPEDALRSAVSLELLHSAFLVHDDIEDESEERRGAPTLHAVHGVPAAVNAGDALVLLGLRPLLGNRTILGPRVSWRVLEEAERMARECVEGQATELRWRRENASGLTEQDYLLMTLKKTCWYTTIYPCRIGALIGTRDGIDLDRFVRFGFFLGAAFQIQDDVLNVTGDHDQYGKELDGDLREGKRSLMLIHMLATADLTDKERLLTLLAMPRAEKPAGELTWLREALRRYRSCEYARAVAHGLAGAALHEFGVAFAPARDSRDKSFIESLPHWVLERT
jgi:geranylgeranyl diphosphate synthase type II